MFEHLEEEVHVSPEEIEAEVKKQLDEKLVHLTAEKDEINLQSKHQIEVYRDMRDDI